VGMPLFGVRPAAPAYYGNDYTKWFAFAAVYCGKCLTPFGIRVTSKKQRSIPESDGVLNGAFSHPSDITHFDLNWELIVVEAGRPTLEHLPSKVEKALRQADENLQRPGCEEPAAVFYGRAIELALKHAHSSVTGTLAQRIAKLAQDRIIPQAMSDWATQVRVVRNDGAHDDGVSREDVEAARDFTDAFLRYLITMPALVEARRPAPPPETPPP
jgi:hypothetical protein